METEAHTVNVLPKVVTQSSSDQDLNTRSLYCKSSIITVTQCSVTSMGELYLTCIELCELYDGGRFVKETCVTESQNHVEVFRGCAACHISCEEQEV